MSTPEIHIRRLVGQRCWYVSAGGSTAPSFALVLGNQIPRDRPLANAAHPTEFRENRGSVELLVWCSWRLERAAEVLASSDQESAGLSTLKDLVGASIVEATCSPPAWDLRVRFSNGLIVAVFCDHVQPEASVSQNWELWSPIGYVGTGPGADWTEDPTAAA